MQEADNKIRIKQSLSDADRALLSKINRGISVLNADADAATLAKARTAIHNFDPRIEIAADTSIDATKGQLVSLMRDARTSQQIADLHNALKDAGLVP